MIFKAKEGSKRIYEYRSFRSKPAEERHIDIMKKRTAQNKFFAESF